MRFDENLTFVGNLEKKGLDNISIRIIESLSLYENECKTLAEERENLIKSIHMILPTFNDTVYYFNLIQNTTGVFAYNKVLSKTDLKKLEKADTTFKVYIYLIRCTEKITGRSKEKKITFDVKSA